MMKKSKQQKKEEKIKKRKEAEDKLKNLTKTQKWIGIGIIGILIIAVFSCQPSDDDVAKRRADKSAKQEAAALAEANKRKEPGISSTDAKVACLEIIKTETQDYDKVDINYLADSTFLKDASGKATASIGFSINNGQGVNLPFVGYCYFNVDESLRTFEIQEGRR